MAVPAAKAPPAGRRLDQIEALGRAFRHTMASLRHLRGRQTRLGAHELSRAQFELLVELLEHGDLQAGELAHAAQVSPATVSGMLDHLVACGHVERLRSESDRRVVVCRLTDEGRVLLEAHKALWHARWASALADIPVADLKCATAVLTRIAEMFDQAQLSGPGAPAGEPAPAAGAPPCSPAAR
ncbi:MAG: MarR family transcriptional regulator [Acidobacteriota bacterium]|nr:MarR family transcriptional regulator [Acidobacteriota bacterium]